MPRARRGLSGSYSSRKLPHRERAPRPVSGESSDDGAPGNYNVEELDNALERERQAAEDAQKELDEAFERAFQQIAADEEPDSITVPDSATAPANKLRVRHVAGRELHRLEYQARNPIHSRPCRVGTDRQSKTAMKKTVLKPTPGSVDAMLPYSGSMCKKRGPLRRGIIHRNPLPQRSRKVPLKILISILRE